MPKLLLILDGLGDRPLAELEGLTPLQAARTPNLDYLARHGQCGVADPVKPGVAATTASGTLAILGYDPLQYPIKRGVIEAFGANIPMQNEDIAWRGNWACLDERDQVLDRRAGRIREGTQALADSLSQIELGEGLQLFVAPGTEHRFALVLRGAHLSDQVVGSDPLERNPHGQRVIPHAFNAQDVDARQTARLLESFEQQARKILREHPVNQQRLKQGLVPANAILTREAGKFTTLPPLQLKQTPLKALCIAGDHTVIGIAKMLGMEICSTPRMTANLDTALSEKFAIARKHLTAYHLVVLHIKGCDIAAHSQQGESKRDFLEKIDLALGQFLASWKNPIRIAVTSDHGTWSQEGYHVDDPVPVLIYGALVPDDQVSVFSESQAATGALGRFRLHHLLEQLLV